MELYLLIYNDVFYFVSFCWCIIWVLDVYTYLCLYCMFIHWCVYVYVYIFRCSPVPGGQWPPGLYLLVREDPSKPVFASRWWNIYIYIYVYIYIYTYTDMDCWTTFQKQHHDFGFATKVDRSSKTWVSQKLWLPSRSMSGMIFQVLRKYSPSRPDFKIGSFNDIKVTRLEGTGPWSHNF